MITTILAIVAIVLVLVRTLSPRIYDHVIVSMTRTWYAAFLSRSKVGDRVLDVGIGTASALCENASAVRTKKLNIVGVDYEKRYVEYSKSVIKSCGLEERVRTVHASVYVTLIIRSWKSDDREGLLVPSSKSHNASFAARSTSKLA